VGFETVSNGISRLRIKGYFYNTTGSNVYAPTETANQEEIEYFYVTLSNVYDAVILMGVAILAQKLGKN